MRVAKILTATGEVVGVREGDMLPAQPAGMSYFAIEAGVDPTGQYLSAGALKPRTATTMQPITALVGEAVAIPVPAGANWSVDDASYIGPRSVTFTTPGVRTLMLHGAWMGQATVTVTTLADLELSLIERIKEEAERRRMLVMSTGGSKKTVYAAKAAEVENWNSLGVLGATVQALLLVFNGLNSTVRARKFRFAIKDAASHGDTVDKAIARFTAGADASLTEAARIEGIEQAAVDRIRAATTRQAKLGAFNAINWAAA